MGYERDEDYKGIDLEKLRIVVEAAQKRYISMAEGRMLYSLGRHSFDKLVKILEPGEIWEVGFL